MALDFEDQTPKTIYERTAADVKLNAPKSNPTKINSFLRALVKAFSFRIYDFYKQFAVLKIESFPDTSTIDGELTRWASYKNIHRKDVTGSSGSVIATGKKGTQIDKDNLLTYSDITFITTDRTAIGDVGYALVTLVRNGTTVTAQTSAGHNLASGLKAVISGAEEEIFNGEFQISVQSATSFTYAVAGDEGTQTAKGNLKATLSIAFVPVKVSEESKVTGSASNLNVSTTVKFSNPVDFDSDALVSYNGLSGGADLESVENFRSRVIDAYQNPVANFNIAAIERQILENVANATRVFVKPITPTLGQVTIYFVCDNTGVIPTGQDVLDCKATIEEIRPVTTSPSSIFIRTPKPKYVDFNFIDLTPNTLNMRKAITDRLKEFFYSSSTLETTISADSYRAKISDTVDAGGKKVEDFALSTPQGDIEVGEGEIAVLRNVVFASTAGKPYIEIMFDGEDGRSDGTKDGISKELTGSSITVNIVVFGTFASATVTLQEYSQTDEEFKDTSVHFTSNGNFSGLFVRTGARYRLNITGATATTDIKAKVNYS